ncbi:aspartic peptidase A1 [Wolfiporia cocos MD-104 SS10]|uniref:Aspartic peptidase A1 n=1 Tax=Wolfiporia cocos (strain MD-104) TaxID=742152 RepID=A0A2H3JI23_WOLCO|nr:aspartic peptidase A1 [Wolfiporia cocos MD-104 SS10]
MPSINDATQTSRSFVSLPFARRMNYTGSADMVEIDRARARMFCANRPGRGQVGDLQAQGASMIDIDVTSQAVSYVTEVQIGNPPTAYTLLIDTGSSNTWVGANKSYVTSGTTMPTTNLISLDYGSGSMKGIELLDQVTLAPGLTIENQSIGVAWVAEGFDGVDGILGIGPTELACGTLFPDIMECVPTVTDNAWSKGLIGAYEVGISFAPVTEVGQVNGELTFGGIDPSKYTGTLNYVPITSSSPANKYVGIDQSVSYGDVEILSKTAGIVDTGTTLLMLSSDAFNTYKNLTGATMDQSTQLLRITREQYSQLKSMYFHIGDSTYEFTPNAQLWPRALNTELGGTNDGMYLIVSDLGELSGNGIEFINGMSFLERFYTVYDVENSRVGLATTRNTYVNSN